MKFKVENMMCGGCTSKVQSKLEALDGVDKVSVDLAAKTAEVQGSIDPQLVIEALTAINHPATLID